MAAVLGWRLSSCEVLGMRLWVIGIVFILCLVLPVLVAGGADSCKVVDFATKIEFPYRFRMVPNHVLIVHGRHIEGDVELDWEPGDSLRINGVAVIPFPPSKPREYSEEELRRVYGEVPFVLERVRAGSTWAKAVEEHDRRVDKVVSRVRRRYWAVRDSTGSHGKAMRAALASLDRSLLDPEVEPRSTGNGILLKWDGLLAEGIVEIGNRPGSKPRGRKELSEAEAQLWAKLIIRRLAPENETPMVVAISRKGVFFFDSEDSRKAIRQLEEARRGVISEGPLPEYVMEEILEVYGGE